eukprot:3311745-Pleurochrysis_carterae.AAC.1
MHRLKIHANGNVKAESEKYYEKVRENFLKGQRKGHAASARYALGVDSLKPSHDAMCRNRGRRGGASSPAGEICIGERAAEQGRGAAADPSDTKGRSSRASKKREEDAFEAGWLKGRG